MKQQALSRLLVVPTVSVVLICAAGASARHGAPPISIELELVTGGLAAPLSVTHAGDGSGRLFITDQAGQVRIVQGGVLLPTPFLDVSSKLPSLGGFFDERGLLGLAFHPDFANNGRFFVRYSTPRQGGPNEPCSSATFIAGCHSEVLAEYKVSAGDPNVADAGSEIILFTVDEPEFNHDGGDVAFGPDGFLYFALGDGGGANDGLHLNGLCDAGTCVGDASVCSVSAQDCADSAVCGSDVGPCSIPSSPICSDGSDCLAAPAPVHGVIGNGQNTATALGAMLRIDVDSPPAPGLAYAIPPGNPFAGGGGLPEIYAYGFRNPYRFSFDDGPGGDGSLYVADVGQALYEEVDRLPVAAAPGLLNYGWAVREGLHCFDPFDSALPPGACTSTGPLAEPLLDPVNEYLHPVGCSVDGDCAAFGVGCDSVAGLCENEGGISVIGGFVYRGSGFPELVGKYVFGDFSAQFVVPAGRLYFFDTSGPNAFERTEFILSPSGGPLGLFVKGFGEDESGELYLLASTALAPFGDTGSVFRIVPPTPAVASGVPTVSEWGLVAMTLAGFTAGTILFGRPRRRRLRTCTV